MNEWGVVGVIVTLVGLAAAIIKPIVQLNTNIVKLTDAVEGLKNAHTKMEESNTEEHKQLHERINITVVFKRLFDLLDLVDL